MTINSSPQNGGNITSPTETTTTTDPNTTSPSSLSISSDFYIVSPPPKNLTSTTRTSLTPPPCSEKINRAIRTAEHKLDAEVENVQQYILSNGYTDGHGAMYKRGDSPESDYSDDLLSPKVLPDFRSPIMRYTSPVRSTMKPIHEMEDVDMKRRIFDDLDEEEDADVDFDKSASTFDDGGNSEASGLEGDMSNLKLGADQDKESEELEPEFQNSAQDSDEESDDSSIVVTTKRGTRRIIDDEESSVESVDKSDGGEADTEKESEELDATTDSNNSVPDDRQNELKSNKTLDDAFSGLVIDDEPGDIEDAPAQDASNVSEPLNITIQTINDDSDDDDDIVTTEGCGCWTIDKETKDLHLPPDSGKWPRIRLPFATYQKLYQHQRIGIQWMASLHRNTIKGGILADDMGMGKTMQTLVYLGSLMRAETIHNAMVVCPKSLVRNWEREANVLFKDIAPKCEVYAITSDVAKEKRIRLFREAFCSSFKKPKLVVTTYGLISNNITELNNMASDYPEWQWCYVVLDEGHCIKNPNTNISKHVRIICSNKKTRRLLLTGTPIQNNLRELHTLFDWATSGQLLGSSKTFLNKYGAPIEEGRQKNASDWEVKKAAEMSKKLQEQLQPYFLQRLKSSEFQDNLPTKRELVVFVSLTKKQRSLYQKYLDGGMIKSVLSGETASPLTAIAHLKQLCGHPSLVREDRAAVIDDRPANILLEESAKLQVLYSLMQRLKRAGHRALIFSQSTKMLDVMERVFDGSFTYLRIDGQSAEKSRQRNVDDFNDKDSGIDCMLLSTKAAGVGLTLNGANRAIIFDPSWNPAEDAQAVDRCYRIGQSKNVTVYRMITAGTVEEKMYEKQVHKDGIKRVLLTESVTGSTKRYFDQTELRDLFKLAPPDAPCSMLTKFNGASAMGSSGKRSFLSSHSCVVGVASHDVLYNNDTANDSNTVDLTTSGTGITPFSRSPFKTALQNNSSSLNNAECVEANELPNLKPLGGGFNRSRQARENAKVRHEQKKQIHTTNNPVKDEQSDSIESKLIEAEAFAANGEEPLAMDTLLKLLEDENIVIQGDTKLKVHQHISTVASKLGWL